MVFLQHITRLAALATLLSGVLSCATVVSYERAMDSWNSSGSCCESFAQFRYDQLAGDADISFRLDASSDAFDFQSGKSYFRAFRLPANAPPYCIRITSYALGETIKKAHILYPQLALLDERFAVIRQSSPADFVLSKAGLKETAAETWGLPVKLEGSLLVDSPDARYVLVFTTEKFMSSASTYVARQAVPITVPGLITAVPGRKEAIRILHSPFGLLHMEIARADSTVCGQGSEADIEPKSAITARFTGRDARIIAEALEPGLDTTRFDTVVVLQGANIPGGTVAIGIRDGCLVGSKFLSGLDYTHATRMLALYRTNPVLQCNEPQQRGRHRG